MSDTVVTGSKSEPKVVDRPTPGFLSGRRGRQLRENLLAYIFLFPAFLIVFTFGLFPLAFSAYESTLRGLNRILGTYDGMGNYVKAVDNLAYVLGFWMGLIIIFLGVRTINELRKTAAEKEDNPWILALPGAIMGITIVLLFRFVFTLLPEMLAIPDQMRASGEGKHQRTIPAISRRGLAAGTGSIFILGLDHCANRRTRCPGRRPSFHDSQSTQQRLLC